MKKLFLFCCLLLGSMTIAFAQIPQGFKYQAVARDAGGTIIKNQVVGLRLSILKGGATGNVIFTELHSPTSGDFGVFSLNIGQGILLLGDFSSINWGADTYWLRVEMDAMGGNNYQIMGTSQLLAVPYALHARTVDEKDDADADPTNELQAISKTGNTVSLSNGGGSFIDAVNDLDADPGNELQTLALNGTQIQISNGNTINLAPILPPGGTDDQTIALNGTNLSIEDGNTIDLSILQDGVNDADADPANELQTLALNGTQIEISNGNTINLAPILPPGGTDDQTIALNGATLSIEDGNSVDLSAFASPWLPTTDGIYYDAGLVYSEKQQVDSLVRVGNNTPSSSVVYNDGISVDYFNLNGSSAFLKGDNLLFSKDNPTYRKTQLGIDSLEFFRENVGLLYSSRSKLDPDYLTFEYGPARTEVNAGSIWNTSGTFNSSLIPFSMSISEVQGNTAFDRVRLEPDSLTLWNSSNNKNAWFGTESYKGNGGLHLYNGSNNLPIVRLGDWDQENIFGGAAEGGLYLYDDMGKAKASLYSIFGSGNLFVEDEETYSSSGQGAHAAGNLDPSGGAFDLVTPKFLAGVDNRTGYVNIYDDFNPFDPQPAPKAGMKVDVGEGCIFSDGCFKIKYPNSDTYSTQASYYEVALFDSTGAAAASMRRDFALPQVGYLNTFGENYSLNFQAGPNWFGGTSSGGSAIVFDANDDRKAGMVVDANNNGHLFAVNGEHQIRDNLGNRWAYTDKYGYNLLNTEFFASFVASMYRYPGEDNTGAMFTAGDQGSLNVFAGHNIFSASVAGLDRGYMAVADESSLHRAGMFVNDLNQGVVFGDIKNFRMQHPKDPTKEIWYASLEGPEAAAYIRGTATLENGEAFVRFADHFQQVANPASMTAILTPLSADTYGLAVIEKTAEGIRVKELKGGTGNFSFDWEVKCVRAGFESFEPVRERNNSPVLRPSIEKK